MPLDPTSGAGGLGAASGAGGLGAASGAGGLGPLPEPVAEVPRLWGAQASGDLAPWPQARNRLADARNVWLCGVDGGRPHARPVWAVWLSEGLAFSTGSPVLRRACDGGPLSATTEGGDEPVILEGTGRRARDRQLLERFAAALNQKYDWQASATEEGMADGDGNAGPVFVLRPHLAFAWGRDMTAPTRWRFA